MIVILTVLPFYVAASVGDSDFKSACTCHRELDMTVQLEAAVSALLRKGHDALATDTWERLEEYRIIDDSAIHMLLLRVADDHCR